MKHHASEQPAGRLFGGLEEGRRKRLETVEVSHKAPRDDPNEELLPMEAKGRVRKDDELLCEDLKSTNLAFRLFRSVKEVNWRHPLAGAVVLLGGFGIMGLDYFMHPEARELQDRVVQELKSLPLPPGSIEEHFSSGFQPSKGSAERTIVSGLPEKETCAFYQPIMAETGWRLVKNECYPAQEGHTLIEFRKGVKIWKIDSGKESSSGGKELILVTIWMR
jgi:hypothetical protein